MITITPADVELVHVHHDKGTERIIYKGHSFYAKYSTLRICVMTTKKDFIFYINLN